MKKLLSISLCVAAVSAFADGSAEVVLGEVGVTEISSMLSNTVVALSYDDLAGGTGSVYSNLVKTTNLENGDRLIEYRDGKYTGWILAANGDVKYWKGQTESYMDGAGKTFNLESPNASSIHGAVGTGIWLVRQNPTDKAGNAIPFYIYGKPASSKSVTTVAGKWMLVGNPKQTEAMFSAEGLTKSADFISLPGEIYQYTYKGEKLGWRSTSNKDKPLPPIPAGTGFWLKTTDSVTIHW